MATKTTTRSVARPSKAAPPRKSRGSKARMALPRAKAAPKPKRKSAPVTAPSARRGSSTVARGASGQSPLMKLLTQAIGPALPAAKLLNADGMPVTPSGDGIQILQVAPTPDRMSWIYTTVGVSTTPAAKHSKPFHFELAAQWKTRDPKSAARILSMVAKHALDNGIRLNAGDVVTTDSTMDLRADGVLHWLVCPPDRATPSPLKVASGSLQMLLLLGITEDELQMGLKVRPEVANGRLVLLEAMRTSGVYPISDPARGCMTRRRDFHRIWETSFRTVREKAAQQA